MKSKIDYIICGLLFSSSGLFLTSITSLSPIYFLFLTSVLFYVLKLFFSFTFNIDKLAILNMLVCLYFLVIQSIIPQTKIPNIIGLALPYFYFFFILQNSSSLTIKEIIKIASIMIFVHTLLFSIDAFWRLSHPSLYGQNLYTGHTRELNIFYMFKFNSLMYMDANFVGVQICLTYFFSIYLIKENLHNDFIKKLSIALFVLVLLTTSRSAIITAIVFTLIFKNISFPYKMNKRQVLVLIITSLLLILVSYVIYNLAARDESFLSKFEILNLALQFVLKVSLNAILFGVGIGNAYNYLGIGAHNLFVTLIVETGILGLTFFLLIVYFIVKKTSGKALYIILPLFTMGFSFVSIAFPFLFTQLAIIYIVENFKPKTIHN